MEDERVSRSSVDSSGCPGSPEESRGSSVSTELREEYEDLLRYAVVTPRVDTSKMAVGGGDLAAMVPGAAMVSTGPQRARESMSQTSRSVRVLQPPPSPLNPEVKVVESLKSDSIVDDTDPPSTASSSNHGESQPRPSSKAPPPYTAMTAHRDLQPGMSQGGRGGVAMPAAWSNEGPRHNRIARSCELEVPRPPIPPSTISESSEPMRVSLTEQLPRLNGHMSSSEIMIDGRTDDMSSESLSSVQVNLMDPEMKRLEGKMDTWCLDLKRNVLAEFEQSRLRLIEAHLAQFRKERELRAQELKAAREELERFKELLVTYEQSISRKDHVVSNLTRAMQKLRENLEVLRSFNSWKLRLLDSKRENFTSALASLHHRRRLMTRVWAAWFGVIHGNWKAKVERACQLKAEEVCMKLSGEYEEKLKALNQALEGKNQEVKQLHAERDLYEENMKKAFMRGVCALNMEAMSMFKYAEDKAYDAADRENEDPTPPPPSDAVPSSSDHAHQQRASPPPTTEEAATVMFRGVKASKCKPVAPKQLHLITSGSGSPWTKVTPPVINPSMAASVQNSKVSFQHFMPTHKRVGPGPAGQELRPPPEAVMEGRGRGTGRSNGHGTKAWLKPPTVYVRKHLKSSSNNNN